MLRTSWLIVVFNAVWFAWSLSLCVPKDIKCKEKVKFMEKVKFTGKAIYSGLAVKDFRSCALYCLWSEKKCAGISFEEQDNGKGLCVLLSDVTSCEKAKNEWSAYNCYSSQAGKVFEWEMFPKDLKTDMDGSYVATKGSDLVLSCSIPKLDDLFISEGLSYKWYKRNAFGEDRIVMGDDRELILKSVESPSSSDVNKLKSDDDDGFYSCEITMFSKITIRSPERRLYVTYLSEGFRGPKMTEFSTNAPSVSLQCSLNKSNPPAIMEWYKRTNGNEERISKVKDLSYVIVGEKLIILKPTKKSTEGNYFCRARNAMMTSEVESVKALVRCIGDKCENQNTGVISPADILKDVDKETLKTLKNTSGGWQEKEQIFRCFFNESIGERITWKYGNDNKEFREGDGVHILEGNQVLMMSPEKIRQLKNDSVYEVTCATKSNEQKLSLPSQKEDFITKTLMLNLNPDIEEFHDTAGTLFQDIVKDETENKYLLAQADVKSPMIEGNTYLDFLAIKGRMCGEHKLKDCTFTNVPFGGKAQNSSCPGVTAHCKLHKLTQTDYWIDDRRSACPLEKISDYSLESMNVLDAQLVELTIHNKSCPVSSQILLQEFENNVYYYNQSSRLNAVLIILTTIEASNVSSRFRSRAKRLTSIYMEYAQSQKGYSVVHGKKISLVMWKVQFPLTQPAILEFPAAKGEGESGLTLKIPIGLSEISALSGSQSFLVSLYHNPEDDFSSQLGAKRYASKLIDIVPPTKLTGLKEDQEIIIGIKLDQTVTSTKYPKSCYWYDLKNQCWKTDGVTTTDTKMGILECSTTHLTAFSVLMSTGLELSPLHEKILSYMTYVCGGLSCLALVLTLIALTSFKDIRRSPSNRIHVCLTSTMLLAMVLFIGGAKRDNVDETVCKAVAIALHYLWLAVFMWTVVESYNLYVLFIRILSARSSRFILKFAVLVVLIPGVVVGLTAGFSYDSYTDDHYCLLRHSSTEDIPVMYISFYLPIGVSIVVNGGIFIAVIVKIFKKGRYQHFESKVQKVLSQMKAICTLSCVLGLAWVLGFLTFDHPADLAFHYLFAICNSLQGFLIFIFHCAIKPDVFQKWMHYFCNIGKESKSTPSSRSNTPTKSRLALFSGMLRKRSSTVTLSTTVTKLSLTRQLTRQRTNSRDSLTPGIQTAFALMKKGSLEPLEEKSSTIGSPRERPRKTFRKKTISSHSSIGDLPENDITPPYDATPNYLQFIDPKDRRSSLPIQTSPRKTASTEKSIMDVVAVIGPDQHETSWKRKNVSLAMSKDQVGIAGKDVLNFKQFHVEEPNQRIAKEQRLEERLFKMGNRNSFASNSDESHSGRRSISPIDLIKNRRRISPIPTTLIKEAKSKEKPKSVINQPPNQIKEAKFKENPKSAINQPPTQMSDFKLKGKLNYRTSLEIKPPTPIISKLSQLDEWIL